MSRYNAFISYSHGADRLLAIALEHGLKRFAKPWYQRQALRIFRDETDLAAAPRLWTLIQQALDASEFLILLANPTAAKSPWVDRELEHWLKTKGAETVLLVITGGELSWDAARGSFDPAATDAIPERLIDAFAEEPLYVDMRWARGESNLSLHDPRFLNQIADLAAPLHRKPKAELASTEVREHRRTVRIAWSAGMALAALAVLASGLAVLAEAQRRTANAKQREAEITLARSDFVQGIQQIEGDEAGSAIPRLGRSLLLEPSRQSTARRLGSLLSQRWLPPVAGKGPVLTGPVKFLEYSASGRFLVAASTTELQLWDVQAGKLLMPAFKHKHRITHVEFSADEKWLASSSAYGGMGGTHGEVQLWDLHAPENPARQIEIEGMLWSARFMPDGHSIATASAFAIELWGIPDGKRLAQKIDFGEFKQHVPDLHSADNAFADFAVTSDGGELIIVLGVLQPGVVARWSVKENRLKAIEALPLTPGRVAIDASSSSVLLSFPNNSLEFFSLGNTPRKGTAIVLDRETLKPKTRAMPHAELISDIKFLPHGQHIFSAAEDGSLKLWDAISGAPVPFGGRHRDRASSIDVARHGLLLASGAKDGTARIWNALNGEVHSEALAHSSAVSIVRFDPAAHHLATGTESGTVQIWDLVPRRMFPARLKGAGKVKAAELSADGKRLAVHSQDGVVRIWDPIAGKLLNEFQAPESASFHFASGGVLVIANRNRFRVMKSDDAGPTTDWIDLGSKISQVSLDPRRGRFLTATAAGTVDLWDLNTAKQVGASLRHEKPVNSAIFTPDGRVLSAAGASISLWNPIEGRALKTAENKTPRRHASFGGEARQPAEVIDLRMTSDGQRVVALYGYSGVSVEVANIRGDFVPEQVALWSKDLQPIADLDGKDDSFTSVALSPDGKFVATAARDGVVRLWSAETGAQAGEALRHSFNVQQLDFSEGSDRLVVAGRFDRVSIWRGWGPEVRPITLRTDGEVRRLIVGAPGGTLLTLSHSGAIELWDGSIGQPIVDKLAAAGETNLVAVDALGESIATFDEAGHAWIWRLPLPPTDAARCHLVKTAERVGGLGLSDSDVAVPLASLRTSGGTYSQKCAGSLPGSADPIGDWLAQPRESRTIGPGVPIRLRDYVREILNSDPTGPIAVRLMLEEPSDPCVMAKLAEVLANGMNDPRMSNIGKFLIRQIGLTAVLSACE